MGALHEGHLTLVRRSVEQNNCSIVSIFVNPSQFNDLVDFEKYPRNETRDIEILSAVLGEDDVVFLPSVEEMYRDEGKSPGLQPPPLSSGLDNLKNCMCGRKRSGHFEGVLEVVGRFLEILNPPNPLYQGGFVVMMYMGEKDYQQLKIVENFVKNNFANVEIVACPTVRESDGLAMSSRNTRLSKEGRVLAGKLFKAISDKRLAISKGKEILHFVQNDVVKVQNDFVKVQNDIVKELESFSGIEIDYVEIRDADDLCEVSEKTKKIIIAGAIFVDGVRLIDGVFLELRAENFYVLNKSLSRASTKSLLSSDVMYILPVLKFVSISRSFV